MEIEKGLIESLNKVSEIQSTIVVVTSSFPFRMATPEFRVYPLIFDVQLPQLLNSSQKSLIPTYEYLYRS